MLTVKENKAGTLYKVDENNEIVEKNCKKCLAFKKMDEYPRNKKGLGGRASDCKECQRKYRSNNRSRILEREKNYRINNKEIIIERRKKSYLKHKENHILRNQLRRARLKKLSHTLTISSKKKLLLTQKGNCLLSMTNNELHLEHFIPLAWGHGGTTFENCYYMDSSLNLSKGNRNPFEWVETQSEDVQKRFYCLLVPMMAERNNMSVKEFENYVNYCFENPRTIEELSNDAV